MSEEDKMPGSIYVSKLFVENECLDEKIESFGHAEYEYIKASKVKQMLEQAYMAGQAAEGIDPSYSNAQVYAEKAINNE